MAASRASALKQLSRLSVGGSTARHLHMTGPATYPSPFLTNPDGAATNLASGSKAEHTKRPGAGDVSNALEHTAPTRQFNTSRTLKAVNDSSTIDFAFMPDFEPEPSQTRSVRVPLLPENFAPSRTGPHAAETEESVMRPTITTASADSTHIGAPSALSEVLDNAAIDYDLHHMSDSVSSAARKIQAAIAPSESPQGIIRQVWNDFLDDVLGPAKAAAKA